MSNYNDILSEFIRNYARKMVIAIINYLKGCISLVNLNRLIYYKVVI
jgi:hypothetical protein